MDIASLTASTMILYLVIALWFIIALILKGFAMYRAASKKSKGWFWLLLIFNTVGILPLFYLIFTKKTK